jgi:hypothetical protein
MSVIGWNPDTVYAAREGQKFAADTTLVVVNCATCGVTYAIPDSFNRSARKHHGDRPNGWTICCPFGHTWWYIGKTELERARDQLAAERSRHDQTKSELHGARVSAGKQRAARKRIETRVAAGVCPCCHRTFKQLARHMATKHPDFTPGDVLEGRA